MKQIFNLIFCLVCFSCYAQKSKDFESYYKNAGLLYNCPKNYTNYLPQYDKNFFYYTSMKYIYPFQYNIIDKDSSICIGFNVYKLDSKLDSDMTIQKLFHGRKVNNENKLPIKHKADSINHKNKLLQF